MNTGRRHPLTLFFLVLVSGFALALVIGIRLCRVEKPEQKMARLANISASTIRSLHEGMTESDIVSLFGAPPGDYRILKERTTHVSLSYQKGVGKDPPKLPVIYTQQTWLTDEYLVVISFDSEGKAFLIGSFQETKGDPSHYTVVPALR